MGCEVHWHPESQEYVCPCHDGLFDPDGRPIAGPPTRPLRAVSLLVDERVAVIPNRRD
jgi:Rieske Fe-S protein